MPQWVCRVLVLLALACAAPALAQEPSTAPETAPGAAAKAPSNDIVVNALRQRADEEVPVEASPAMGLASLSRRIAGDAARFTDCAGLPRLPLLHRIVDGRPETGETEKALHQHIMRNAGCYKGLPMVPPYPPSPHYGVCNPIVLIQTYPVCRVHYDRGAIYEQVLRTYAPDLRLSRSNTFDIATRARFREREEARNAGRTSSAYDYFFIAACMVQVRPEFALALLREDPGSARENRLRALMMVDGAPCMGKTAAQLDRIEVDATQFRAFVAEAVYAWAVAVRRTGTLLPPLAQGGA